MRFGINAQRLAGQRLGVGRYIEYMFKYWDTMLHDNDVVNVYVQFPFDKNSLGLSDRFRVHHLKPNLGGKAWENVLLPIQSRNNDVLYGPSYTLPVLYPGRTVVAIHSVNEVAAGAHSAWYHLTYERLYRLSASKADVVIVPSESVKQDITSYYGTPLDKLEIIGQGADVTFIPVEDEAFKRAARMRHVGEDVPYLLWVGKLSQRRNIPLLLEAFSILKRRDKIPHKLLLFGPNHLNLPLDELTDKLGIRESVIQTDGVLPDHRELIAVYNGADAYVNASLYEGFSMTLVEALACGLPVIVSNRAALREISGEAGIKVDEVTAEAFADAVSAVLRDPSLQAELRRKSIERSAAYRWERFARQTLDVLRRVGEQST